MSETGWIIIVVAVIAVALVFWLARGKQQTPPAKSIVPPSEAAPVAPPAAAPIAAAAPAPATPTPATPQPAAPALEPAPLGTTDDLLRLKGVGPKIAAILHEQGITRFAQIAAWTDADIAAIDAKLGNFSGRPRRDNWVEQAQLLASGDTAAYEAKYGKL